VEGRGGLSDDQRAGLYRARFQDEDLRFRERAWAVLAERVFQPYIRESDAVLDLGAGYCEFLNAIRAGRKIAVDLNPDTSRFAAGSEVIQASGTDLSPVSSGSVDVVFSSNFLEHLPDKRAILVCLRECWRVLRPGGLFITLMPNIRYLPGRYWDYFDHHTPLTHLSLAEALRMCGFSLVRTVPRFLPYTVKQRALPKSTVLLRLYLRLPIVWPLVGRQMLVVARRSTAS
jgi:SAM-dependent methyltransferase